MSVRPVDIGMVQRMNDVSQIKHNENSKPAIDQNNMLNSFNKEAMAKTEQVARKDSADNNQKKFDASEKGSNSYSGNPSNKKDKSKDEPEGKVVVKGHEGFDVTI